MSSKNFDLRKVTLRKIIARENAQIYGKRNSLEPLLLTNRASPYPYGRWFVGRDSEGDALYRTRRAGIVPKFHDHSYADDMYKNNERHYLTKPSLHFQYPTETHHRRFKTYVNTYR